MIKAITPDNWADYELIDSGNGMKLEKFAGQILARPEPQAIWNQRMTSDEWNELKTASFAQEGSHKGVWKHVSKLRPWYIHYRLSDHRIKMKLNFNSMV